MGNEPKGIYSNLTYSILSNDKRRIKTMTKYIGKGVDILQIVDNDNSINIFFGSKYFYHDIIMVKEYINRDNPTMADVINFIRISKINSTII
jgi:hypothetical protein